ncbi:MAG: TolC family protein [Balneolaceae bacterium]|nr:MAG: TolC family protein [Balneolaceae bacterium]
MNSVQIINSVYPTGAKLLLAGLLLVIIGLSSALAQQNGVLQEYIEQGVERNLTLLNAILDYESAASELRSTRGRFMPEASLEASYSLASGGRTIDFPLGDLFNPVYGTLNELTGSQRFPTNMENINEQLLPDNFHETKIRIVQPLFNSDLYFSYRAQRDLVSAREARLNAVENDLIKEIRLSYHNYFASADQLAILESNRELVQELVRTTESLVRNGKATIDQQYTAEFELTELDGSIAYARRQQQTAKARFNQLLDRELSASIEKDEAYFESRGDYPDADILQETSLLVRPEFTELSASRAAAANLLSMNRTTAIPDLFVVGDLGYQGRNYSFSSDQEFWFVQFGMRWSLFRGFQNREKIARSRIELNRLDNRYRELEQEIQLRVTDARNAVTAAQAREQAAITGLEAAESGFRIVMRRYEENSALMVEYLRAQDMYTRARLSASLARYQLKSAEAVLERETGR